MLIYVKLLLTALFWGGTFVAGRMIAGSVGPFSAAFLRFLLAGILLALILKKREGRIPIPRGRQIILVCLLGLTGVFAYNAFFFTGLHHITAGRASLIIATNPICISLLSALIFKESLTFRKGAGILISVSGAIVVISKGNPAMLTAGGGVGIGEWLIFGCVASWVSYSLIGKVLMHRMSPLASVTWSAMVGAGLLMIPALVEGVGHDLWGYGISDWCCLAYLGIFGTVLGFVWYYEGIRRIGPMRAGLFINGVPVSAIVLAALILSEPITFSLIAGAALVGTGVYLTNTAAAPDSAEALTPSTGASPR